MDRRELVRDLYMVFVGMDRRDEMTAWKELEMIVQGAFEDDLFVEIMDDEGEVGPIRAAAAHCVAASAKEAFDALQASEKIPLERPESLEELPQVFAWMVEHDSACVRLGTLSGLVAAGYPHLCFYFLSDEHESIRTLAQDTLDMI